ncbi:MAG: serpin family protein [Nocardiopsaceae bacterium]|nr:serpin family protein [Nocardiopsaceae bacterium]
MTVISPAAHADAAFGADLYRTLDAASDAASGNLVFSPASVAAALKMALVGACGQTADELARALRVSGPDEAAGALAELAGIRSGDDLTLSSPNTMWLDSTLSVRDEFMRRLAGGVSAKRCDFIGAPDAARETINSSVATATAGKITGLIQRGLIDSATRLVLVNAIYLKALWQHQFPVENTKDKPFYPEQTNATALPFMRLGARLAYHRGDGCQSVLLPYRGGPLAMAVLLPDEMPLSEFARSADLPGALAELLGDQSQCQVDLSLPRFRVEAGFRLEDTLRSLGVRLAFTDGADFGGISAEPLSISAVVHKAWIDVGEKGTEAAAATAGAMRTLAAVRKPEPDVRLVVDRPFLFAITDTDTGLPLFLGQFAR